MPRKKRKKTVSTYAAVVVVVHLVNQSVTLVLVVKVDAMPDMSIAGIDAWGPMDGMWCIQVSAEVAEGIAMSMSMSSQDKKVVVGSECSMGRRNSKDGKLACQLSATSC